MEGGAGAMQAPPAQHQGNGDKGPSPGKSTSRTITDTIVGECQTGQIGLQSLSETYFLILFIRKISNGRCSSI